MKNLILFLFVGCSFQNVSGQLSFEDPVWSIDTSRHIPNNSIYIKAYPTTFKDACNALLDAGLLIDKKDNDLMTAETRMNEYKDMLLVKRKDPTVHLRMKGDTAVFYGLAHLGDLGSDKGEYQQTKKGKPRLSHWTAAFLQAYVVARKLNVPLYYSR